MIEAHCDNIIHRAAKKVFINTASDVHSIATVHRMGHGYLMHTMNHDYSGDAHQYGLGVMVKVFIDGNFSQEIKLFGDYRLKNDKGVGSDVDLYSRDDGSYDSFDEVDYGITYGNNLWDDLDNSCDPLIDFDGTNRINTVANKVFINIATVEHMMHIIRGNYY